MVTQNLAFYTHLIDPVTVFCVSLLQHHNMDYQYPLYLRK